MTWTHAPFYPLRQEAFDRLLPEDLDPPEPPEQFDDEFFPEPDPCSCSWEDQPPTFDGT